jgi:Flp pilus assembly protein TadD
MLVSQLATLLLADGQISRARETIEKCPAETRRDVRVLSTEARIAASEEPEKGSAPLAAVEKAVETIPTKDAVSVLFTIMAIRMQQRDSAEAERLATVILKREPGDLRTHSALVELATDQRDVEKLSAYARRVGDIVGLSSPQFRVAQAMVQILKVRLNREKRVGDDAVPQPLTPEDRQSLDEARNLLLEAENDRPGWFQIHQSLAELAGIRGDTAGAITHLQKAIASGATNPASTRMLAALLRQSGRLEEAREAIALLGTDGGVVTERIAADIDAQSGRIEAAIARAERITPSTESDPDHLMWYGNLLQKCGKGEQAVEVLERATEFAPQRRDCWVSLIVQQARLGRKGAVDDTLSKAREALVSPDRELVVAATLDMYGQAEEAEQAFREAVAAAPSDPTVARQLADFLIRRGKITAARDELQRIIAMPEAAETTSLYWARRVLAQHLTAGVSYRELEKACDILERNVDEEGRLTPEDVRVEFAILMEREEPAAWRRAIGLINELERRQPLDMEQRTLRAWLVDRLGNWVEAREALVDIAAEEGCQPPVVATLVERMLSHGEIVGARTWQTRLRTIAPDAPMTIRTEAKLAVASGDREGAADAVRKLIPPGPVSAENAPMLVLVAELVEELGFPKAADKLFLECAEASPAGIVARASFLGRQLRTDEAMQLLGKAVGQTPETVLLDAGIGILRVNGTSPSAEADARMLQICEKVRQTDPESAMVPIIQGAALEILGRTEDAERTYREVLAREDLSPVLSARASTNLAGLLADRNSFEEARTLIDSAFLELGPHPFVLDVRGLVWLGEGDTTRAIEDFEESNLAPSATQHLHMANARFDARQLSECRASLKAAESLGLRTQRLGAADRQRLERLDRALADQVAN